MPASWVYILRCADGSYYTGCTTNLDARVGAHMAGTTGGYTATRRPVECVYAAEFQTIHDAIDWERRLKRWNRAKKEAVIAGDWGRLPGLARSYQHHGRREGASFDTAAARPAQDDGQGWVARSGSGEAVPPLRHAEQRPSTRPLRGLLRMTDRVGIGGGRA